MITLQKLISSVRIVHTCAGANARTKAYRRVGQYHPPDCECNCVTFNFTVTSTSRQFNRLALMFFDDVESFRTSTAEPTQNGIAWSYDKDMSSLIALFGEPREIIFDPGNLEDDTFTGACHTTLTATYFTAVDQLGPADVMYAQVSRE